MEAAANTWTNDCEGFTKAKAFAERVIRAHFYSLFSFREDLLAVGIETYWLWTPRFDPSRGVNPETFLFPRVWGAMKDFLRKQDFVPRSERTRRKKEGLDISDPKFISLDHKCIAGGRDCRWGDLIGAPSAAAAFETQSDFEDSVRGLDFEEKVVLYLHFYKGNTFRQIGKVLGVSESRTSQIYRVALSRLRRFQEVKNVG
jgi:RNA polymerase sigma factor FliA